MKVRSIPWPRIVTEFLVIFLGVSLSLAGDDWRQRREDRASEREYLVELLADLSADSGELSAMQRSMVSWDQAALVLAKIDAGLEEVQDSVIVGQLTRLMRFSLYQPVSSAYIGLKQGGQLGLIRDPTLRRQVVEYYEVRQPYMRQFDGLIREAHARVRFILQRHTGFVVTNSVQSYWPPASDREFITSWDALSEEEGARGAIEYVGVLAGNWAARIESVLVANAELRSVLEQRLASSSGRSRG